MNAKSVISDILAAHGHISDVYWVACGGSLIDLYPAHYLVQRESKVVASSWYTAAEFVVDVPARLGSQSLVVVCSHSGNTPEAVEAATQAADKGAAVVVLTDNAGSKIDQDRFVVWVYPWGDDVATVDVPLGICPMVAAELIREQEGFSKYEALIGGIAQMDGIIADAKQKARDEIGPKFAELCLSHDFLYVLGSGPNFSQTYGLAICSLMEMQWQHCSYINSAEYFHGPFECTEPGVFYVLQMSAAQTRAIDQRALDFLKSHTDTLLVLDAAEFGMKTIDASVRSYLEPALFYALNVELRAARGRVFNHDPDYRRYMGKLLY